MPAIQESEQRLRSALAAGDFLQVQQLLPTYTDQIATLLSGTLPAEEKRKSIESFHDLLSLARVMRAHISSQLSIVRRQVGHRYALPTPERHAFRFDG